MKKPFDRKNSRYCVEYWIFRHNMTEEEAKDKIKEIQSITSKKQTGKTVSQKTKNKLKNTHKKRQTLEGCMELYGPNNGPFEFEKNKQRLILNGKKTSEQRFKNGFDRKESPRCKEYWMSKHGLTENEAIEKVSSLQSRSLSYFIDKYGEKDGLDRWKKRIDRFKKSFLKNNNMVEVNEKRRLNAHVGIYTEESIKNIESLHFYALVFCDVDSTPFIKYGLTKHKNISKRWPKSLGYRVVVFDKLSAEKALRVEQNLKKIWEGKYHPQLIHTTEAIQYSIENIQKILEYLKEER